MLLSKTFDKQILCFSLWVSPSRLTSYIYSTADLSTWPRQCRIKRLGYRGSNEDQKQRRPSINIHLWQKKTFASKNDAHLNQRISCCQKVPHLFCMIHQISTNSKWIAKGRRTRYFVWLFHFPLLPVESETTVLWRSWWDKEYWHTFSRVNQDDTSLATSIHHLWSSS